ncbi:MAG TPA: protein-disulfide reductase DsbD domain-containing protein [Roseiarcus sp.]|nr:protein-disulfide reductase DsbD domain-containing protein [Roseiarcus sp.]
MVEARFLGIFAATFIGLGAPAMAADAFSSEWAVGLKSSARLLAGDAADGRIEAGLEIKLAPGAITYWRNPGDAGLPPVLSFEGSTNLAEARPAFPEPQRLNKGDGEAFGYDHSVILPIDVKPIDPARPVALSLKLTYAVCEKICVPAKADLQLLLNPDATRSPYAAAIAEAGTEVPRPVEWASLAGKAKLVAAGDKLWRLCLAPQAGPQRDLFIEAPERWWFDVVREAAPASGETCFDVKLEQKPDDAGLPVKARLTVTGGAGAFETFISLGDQSL